MPKPTAHQFVRNPSLPHLELRTASDSRDCYQTHTHDEYSFGAIDAGLAVYCHGEHRTALKPGMAVMMEPGLAHSCNPDAQQAWSYRMLFVDAQWLHRSFLPFVHGQQEQRLKLSQHSSAAPAVYRALSNIADTLVSGAADALEVDERLLSFIAQYALVPRMMAAEPNVDEQALHAVRDVICTHVESNLSLERLAQASGWSGYQLIRKFKQAFGQTPHAFQIDQRLNLAKKLLKQGAGLADVAHQLGFADQAHFQRHFKKRHAITPKNYVGSSEGRKIL
ncbi:MAG: AraC family transcriptional regulator [Pseudomonadota bacterium]